jgi:hypothetical protein
MPASSAEGSMLEQFVCGWSRFPPHVARLTGQHHAGHAICTCMSRDMCTCRACVQPACRTFVPWVVRWDSSDWLQHALHATGCNSRGRRLQQSRMLAFVRVLLLAGIGYLQCHTGRLPAGAASYHSTVQPPLLTVSTTGSGSDSLC